MTRLDIYLFRQVAVSFAFFCLVLAGLIWLTQAVRLIDVVLSSGQSLWRLLEFSLYVLPRVLALVVPVSGFAAAIFAINKLYGESELVVMMTSGQSPFALARPLLAFGVILAVVTLFITNFLAPNGERALVENRAQIQSEIANSLIREGRFLHPAQGLTIFIRDTDDQGRMEGLFLHDERDPRQPVTYTAAEAVFLRDGQMARLVMTNGVALTYSAENRLLARVQFDSFTYDLSTLLEPGTARRLKASALPTRDLFFPSERMMTVDRYELADLRANAHERMVLGVDALLLPLVALAVMLTGGYQRRGFGRRIVVAILAGTALVVGGVLGKSQITRSAEAWPVIYLPGLLAVLAILFLLWRATQPARRKRAAAPA